MSNILYYENKTQKPSQGLGFCKQCKKNYFRIWNDWYEKYADTTMTNQLSQAGNKYPFIIALPS